jgi:hypothetical protein
MKPTTYPPAKPTGNHEVSSHSFADKTVLRHDAMAAFALPSLHNGKPVPRTRPVLLGSCVNSNPLGTYK